MKITKLKGVLDYYGEESTLFQRVRNVSTKIVESYGYSEVITPIIEQTDVFVRSAGESSDVVGKEMYIFKDRGDRDIALKPESTASVMRMVVENKLYVTPGIKKYYYCSPNFRYERPQAGRYRQFYQFGVETLGEESPYLDAEVIEYFQTIESTNSNYAARMRYEAWAIANNDIGYCYTDDFSHIKSVAKNAISAENFFPIEIAIALAAILGLSGLLLLKKKHN